MHTAPAPSCSQVYTALLKVWQPEGRKLIQEALDVLVPLLPMRLAQAPEVKYPMWIRWTKVRRKKSTKVRGWKAWRTKSNS